MKFLVIQTAFIGDVILATALVEKIHRFYPDAQIDFLLRKGNEALLVGHPYVRKVLVWDKKGQKYKNLLSLWREIRREGYDWVINSQRFAASGLLTAFSGAKKTVGFDKNPFSLFFSKSVRHRIGDSGQDGHEVNRNLLLIRELTDDSFELPRLYPSPHDFAHASSLGKGGLYVCLAPTSVWFTKQWPAHKWVELIARFPESTRVFLLGAPGDATACAEILQASGLPNVQNLAGKLSFLQSAALMKGAAMNYVNDSAPLHMASAMDAPVVAIFCSTLPAFGFGPLSRQKWVIETTADLKCRPCGLHGRASCPQGHFACAETIEVLRLPIQGTAGF